MSEENKQRLKEYQKNYREAKNQHNFFLAFFFLHCIKWNKKPRQLVKNIFKKNENLMYKKPINICNAYIKKIILLLNKKSHNKIFVGYDTVYYDIGYDLLWCYTMI